MCPLCNTCKAWNMSEICTMAKVMNCQITSQVNNPLYNHKANRLCLIIVSKCLYCAFLSLQLGYLFDHPGTVLFSVFMSFWAVTFLEYWKRKMATLAHHWDCMDFHEEEVSQSFLSCFALSLSLTTLVSHVMVLRYVMIRGLPADLTSGDPRSVRRVGSPRQVHHFLLLPQR